MSSSESEEQEGPVGPTDREVVAMLQRLASARAQLLQAEQAVASGPDIDPKAGSRNDEIEEAHTDLLWAQAQLITASRQDRARQALEAALRRERMVLKRQGYLSFREYLADRTSIPTTDLHLEVARREYEAAQAEWDLLQAELARAEESGESPRFSTAPTIVIDFTGHTPRRLV